MVFDCPDGPLPVQGVHQLPPHKVNSYTSLHVPKLADSWLSRDQFIDVCVRVQVVRAAGVKNMLVLLQDQVLFAEDTSKGGMNEVPPLCTKASKLALICQ